MVRSKQVLNKISLPNSSVLMDPGYLNSEPCNHCYAFQYSVLRLSLCLCPFILPFIFSGKDLSDVVPCPLFKGLLFKGLVLLLAPILWVILVKSWFCWSSGTQLKLHDYSYIYFRNGKGYKAELACLIQ
jgi:hypothetical protein